MESIQNLIRAAANDTDIEVRSYSGRAMYGKECIAIVGEFSQLLCLISNVIQNAHTEAFEAALHAEDEDEKDAACELSGDVNEVISKIMDYRTDSMGLSTVLYWPDMEFVAEDRDFDEWKADVARRVRCSVDELDIMCARGDYSLQVAFDDQQSAEDTAGEVKYLD